MNLILLKKKIVERLHLLPMIIVIIQTAFYYQFFFDRDIYIVYMALYDQVLKDSLIFFILLILVIDKWYLINKLFTLGLLIDVGINFYSIIFGMTEQLYFYSIVFIEYSMYVIAIIYGLSRINTNNLN